MFSQCSTHVHLSFTAAIQGWNISKKTDMTIFDYHAAHPELGKRFGGAVATFSKGLGIGPESLVDGYDWLTVRGGHGTVVDVGGADGYTSAAIARAALGLQLIVQDLPNIVASFEGTIPKDVEARVRLVPHDFFTTQLVQADVYILRQILHNWPDPACVKILRALVPAMRSGAKVVANDRVLPPPGELPFIQERIIR